MSLRSMIEPVVWPAMYGGRAAELMSLQRQFDETQYWPAGAAPVGAIRATDQARRAHREDRAILRRAPAARGRQAGQAGHRSRLAPPARSHPQGVAGPGREARVARAAAGLRPDRRRRVRAGSSGVPVRVRKSALDAVLWEAVTIRDEVWHRELFDGLIARLRGVPAGLTPEQDAAARSEQGVILPDWGRPANLIWRTGKIAAIDPKHPVGGFDGVPACGTSPPICSRSHRTCGC